MTDSGEEARPKPVGALFDSRVHDGLRWPMAFVWLLFIIFPLANAVGDHGPALRHALTILGATVFVCSYAALVLSWRRYRTRTSVVPALLFGVLVAVATALTVAEQAGWGFLFTYCAATAAVIAPGWTGFLAVAVCTALAAATSAIAGAPGGTVLGFGASSAGIGLLMLVMRDLRMRNEELSRARAELARLAVAQERERFARDLHDLLGHTLSVITLKAELAGRLLPGRPDEAAAEVAEVEQVARNALSEVRQAVSGYRQPTLDGELAGARMALPAAGIQADVERPSVALEPATEAILAWAVREGATNVIRHSGARHVRMKITASLTGAALEMLDDGVGCARSNGSERSRNGGHGLAGLAERAQGLQGDVDAGSRPEGGFRLAVTVPLSPG